MTLVEIKLVFKRNFPGMKQTIERVPEGWVIELRKPRKRAKKK